MSSPWDRMIKELEAQKEVIDDALEKLKAARDSLGELPPELAKRLVAQADVPRAGQTNFDRIARFLQSSNKEWNTLQDIMDGLDMSRASLNVVLYNKKHRNKFESKRIGEGKALGWRLKSGQELISDN